jgi:hypothetical protein
LSSLSSFSPACVDSTSSMFFKLIHFLSVHPLFGLSSSLAGMMSSNSAGLPSLTYQHSSVQWQWVFQTQIWSCSFAASHSVSPVLSGHVLRGQHDWPSSYPPSPFTVLYLCFLPFSLASNPYPVTSGFHASFKVMFS